MKIEAVGLAVWQAKCDSPVKNVRIVFSPVDQNFIRVRHHENHIKFLRLKKLRTWKRKVKLSKIYGVLHFSKKPKVHITLPPSWKFEPSLKSSILTLCDILFSGTHKNV